ncbi:MAG: hypothetical protein JEZ06_11230 [Anaerolineaceae bacterium]|nr:hypothetical protein [Anaerolineaceae bacterium]
MSILGEIIEDLQDGGIEKIAVGKHWTAVVVKLNGELRCGLSSNPNKDLALDETLQKRLSEIEKMSAREVAGFSLMKADLLPSIGMAAINALLPKDPDKLVKSSNAGDMIAYHGKNKKVVLVGHFPFIPELREQVGELKVLELKPGEGEYHASEAPKIIPEADVVAITSMAFVNSTMEGLLKLCSEKTFVIILGPTSPLNARLFTHGADMICGCIVEEIDPVINCILDGNSFRQIKNIGVNLVSMYK